MTAPGPGLQPFLSLLSQSEGDILAEMWMELLGGKRIALLSGWQQKKRRKLGRKISRWIMNWAKWWILIRNLTYHRPPACVLTALKGMLSTSPMSLCSPPPGDCNAVREPVVRPGEMQPPRLGTALLLLSWRWKVRECASKNDGKGDSVATPPPSWDYQQVWLNCIQLVYCE